MYDAMNTIPMKNRIGTQTFINLSLRFDTNRIFLKSASLPSFKLAFFNGNACHSKQNQYENTNENATYRTSENGNQKKRMKQISWFKSTCTLVSEYLEKLGPAFVDWYSFIRIHKSSII